MRTGDLLVVPAGIPHALGPHAASPWSTYWLDVAGDLLPDYLAELGAASHPTVLRVGEGVEFVRLFNECVGAEPKDAAFEQRLVRSHAAAHLLALLIQRLRTAPKPAADGLHKVAECIEYISEHLDQPLRIARLAAVAGLSPAHFAVRFKEQTASSPREYLRLLRIHRASELLRTTTLSVKDIAGRVGYPDPLHFSRQFKAFQGVAPRDYRAASAGLTVANRS